jgi:hypothetical protein
MPFTAIRAEWTEDGDTMTLIEEATFTDKAGRVWKAPKGFTTDGASIPRALWAWIGSPFNGKYRIAAVFHDSAYRTLGIPKDDADRMFHEAMLESGCDQITARLMFEGVRAGGAEPYAAAQRRAALSDPS